VIGLVTGEVVFSDTVEAIVMTSSGIGYQLHFNKLLAEGSRVSLFVSHVHKENSEELYGFEHLRAKKLFEMLLSVRGVGPKSAYGLLGALSTGQIIEAIQLENKKQLTQAPGVGDKAAAQMILDLGKKIHKVNMYSARTSIINEAEHVLDAPMQSHGVEATQVGSQQILEEALLACRELGFKDEKIIPLAQRFLSQSGVNKPEQLVHLVLREI
jgi:holliday junction DNA helicase RuvA